jgi:hypothetical protein
MPAGRAGLPPPTIKGQTNSWYSSTRSAAKAGAQAGPADGEVAGGCGLQFWTAAVEVAFESGGGCRHGGQGRGVTTLSAACQALAVGREV